MAGGVDVLVVAFGAPELLDGCLTALEAELPVMVVDNSSDPAVRAVVERHGATYLDPGRNLGFAAGVNVGLAHRARTGDPAPTTAAPQPRCHRSAPTPSPGCRTGSGAGDDLACVAPAQVDPVTGEEARVGWPFPTPAGAWLEALGLGSPAAGAPIS